MLYYRPSANEAFESVQFIMTTVPFGWLIRSLHSWSANLMVYFAFIHLASVFFMKAYRPPREITWITGCILFFIIMFFGFSGYLLPWNQLSFFATKVGTDIAESLPLVGEWTLRFLRGGDRVTGGTLSRFYGWHVAILPAVTTLLLGIHLILVQIPSELGEKADPFAPAYKDIRPEWYFMFLFETLKLVPGGEIGGVEFEAIPILLSGVAALLMLLAPFIDRGVIERGKSPGFTLAGVLALVYMVGMTAWGYRSLVPIYAILGTGLLVGINALGTRRVRRDEGAG
jgi:cytochrome b6